MNVYAQIMTYILYSVHLTKEKQKKHRKYVTVLGESQFWKVFYIKLQIKNKSLPTKITILSEISGSNVENI